MSWSFYMTADLGGEQEALVYDGPNCTYNVAPMFRRAFGSPEGIRVVIGKTGAEALPLIERAIAYFDARRDEDAPTFGDLEALNPPNGWGNTHSAYETLTALRVMCKAAPRATVQSFG